MHAEGQVYSVDHASLPSILIAGVERQNVGVDIRPIPAKDADGWIGMGLMRQFVMLMDMPNGKLWLIPCLPSTLEPATSAAALGSPRAAVAPRNETEPARPSPTVAPAATTPPPLGTSVPSRIPPAPDLVDIKVAPSMRSGPASSS